MFNALRSVHRAQSTEYRAQNTEHRAHKIEHRAQAEHIAQSTGRRAHCLEHRAQSIQQGAQSTNCPLLLALCCVFCALCSVLCAQHTHIYYYLAAHVVLGVMALAGWDPPAHGSYIAPPVPPSLEPIRLALGDDLAAKKKIEILMDIAFKLTEARHPDLTGGGRLRPFTETMLATEIMHFEECTSRFGKTHIISKSMVMSAVQAGITTDLGQAAKIYEEWGRLIKLDFQTNNMEMRHSDQLAAMINIGESVQALTSAVTASGAKLEQERIAAKRRDDELKKTLHTLQAENKALSEDNKKTHGLLADVMRQLGSMMSSLSSLGRKRVRAATEATANDTAQSPMWGNENDGMDLDDGEDSPTLHSAASSSSSTGGPFSAGARASGTSGGTASAGGGAGGGIGAGIGGGILGTTATSAISAGSATGTSSTARDLNEVLKCNDFNNHLTPLSCITGRDVMSVFKEYHTLSWHKKNPNALRTTPNTSQIQSIVRLVIKAMMDFATAEEIASLNETPVSNEDVTRISQRLQLALESKLKAKERDVLGASSKKSMMSHPVSERIAAIKKQLKQQKVPVPSYKDW